MSRFSWFSKRKDFEIDKSSLPKHIGVILDGNGRWARRRRLARGAGHAVGSDVAQKIATFCGEYGIKYLTFYAFSTENWKRSAAEVETLMGLLKNYLRKSYGDLAGKNVRIRMIGDRTMLSDELVSEIEALEEHTKGCDGLTFNLAISYGGRHELMRAVKKIAAGVAAGEVRVSDIDELMISANLDTAGQPDPDLIIRPGGEFRLSNFLTWQSAYSELWFTDVLWPDFTTGHILAAISDFQKRNRRYGKEE
jgi:undecaprenyl diphosphate synthase